MVIFKHVGQNVSLELVSVYQTIIGDPNNGLDELEPNRSYLNHFPTWYAQYSHFYLFSCHFRLIKWDNRLAKCYFLVYNFLIFLWHPDTYWHCVLKGGGRSETKIYFWTRLISITVSYMCRNYYMSSGSTLADLALKENASFWNPASSFLADMRREPVLEVCLRLRIPRSRSWLTACHLNCIRDALNYKKE